MATFLRATEEEKSHCAGVHHVHRLPEPTSQVSSLVLACELTLWQVDHISVDGGSAALETKGDLSVATKWPGNSSSMMTAATHFSISSRPSSD